MKTSHYILILLFVVFSMPQRAISQTDHEQIIGTWVFDYETSLEQMSEASKSHFAKIDSIRQGRISQVYKSRKITFNSDGTYIQVFADGKSSTAIWAISGGNSLEISTSYNNSIAFSIKEITSNKLVLSQVNTKGGMLNVLFTHWCLNKN